MGKNAFDDCALLTIYCEAKSQPSGWDSKWNCDSQPVVWDCNNNAVLIDGLRYALKDGNATVARQPIVLGDVVTIPQSVTHNGTTYSVVGIGDYAFSHSSSLTSIEIPSSVTSIGDYAFEYCSSFTSIEIPASVTSIGISTFEGCSSLTSITIPASITSIGSFAFYNCDSLTIYCEAESKPDGWCEWSGWYSQWYVVWDCNNSAVLIDGLRYALKDGNAAVSIQPKDVAGAITIPQSVTHNGTTYSVTSIDYYAFSHCSSLTSIEIPSSVTSINNYAFEYCSSFTSINIPCSVKGIGSYAFYGCRSLTSIEIPSSVTSIGESAFFHCSSLTIYCTVGSRPDTWNYGWNSDYCPVVWDCSNNEVAYDGRIYVIIDGIRYALKDNEAVVVRQPHSISDEIVIPSSVTYNGIAYSVTSIAASAFDNSRSITSITLPASISSIGEKAFYYCNSIESVYIFDISAWCSIDFDGYIANPLYYAHNLYLNGKLVTELEISNAVTEIKPYAFYGYKSLVKVAFGDNSQCTSIGSQAFYNCSSLTSIIIPASVTNIGERAFSGCKSLTIYCEATSKPSGWASNWNYGNRPVVWDYKG